jgi:hypothetical protein
MIPPDSRNCLECGHRISGRVDKKFCNDHCRTAWHNKLQGDQNNYMRSVNTILRRNRRILADLSTSGTKKVEPRILKRLGFEFDYFTHLQRKKGCAWHYCYEHGYALVENGKCVIT